MGMEGQILSFCGPHLAKGPYVVYSSSKRRLIFILALRRDAKCPCRWSQARASMPTFTAVFIVLSNKTDKDLQLMTEMGEQQTLQYKKYHIISITIFCFDLFYNVGLFFYNWRYVHYSYLHGKGYLFQFRKDGISH